MHPHTDPALHHCIEKGGHHAEPGHVRLMMDCIQMCQTSADFMTRNSQLHALICAACAAVCEACANSCEAMADAEMTKCAEICRRCTRSCREMGEKAGLAAHRHTRKSCAEKSRFRRRIP